MADTAINFLLEKLLQVLSEDVRLIAGVQEEFQDLLEQVQILNAFINDFSKLVRKSIMWKEMEKAILTTVFRTEDIIDEFLVEARLNQEKNILRKAFHFAHNTVRHRDLSIKIKDIIEEMKKIPRGDKQALSPAENLQLEIESVKGSEEPKDISLEDDEVVGFDEEAQRLIKRLTEGSEDLDIIPIVGMPGLGKTTLARKIYNDPRISYEFFSKIWIHVGQLYKIKDVFLRILNRFRRNIKEYQDMDANELAKLICSFVAKGGKCLIVLDDVWESEVVDSVMKVFPRNWVGHRIIMTTRLGYVATYANENPHYLKFLSQNESFELLKMNVFGRRSCPHELLRVGESIAKKCSGLPLSIVMIAGALRARTNKVDWVRVDKNMGEYLINKDDATSCLNIIKVSYDSLPQEMQSCFLYCGVFPRGFDIPIWKLIRLWIAEGLIKSKPAFTLEETAQYYLNGLVDRNLVMVMQKKSDGKIKTCRVQDLLHEFCKKEASEKWFFQEVCPALDQAIISIHDRSMSRRLCVQPSALQDFLSTRPFVEHVRSFYCFSTRQTQIELPPSNIRSICRSFPLIRVLDIESLKFLFSRDFYQLFHLRYIAISGDFMALPSAFGKFWNLQTLILSTSAPILEIKADIWNMLRLRHIHTNVPAKLPSPSTSTGKASSLQTLSQVASQCCRKNVLAKACHLKKLSVRGPMKSFLETNCVNLEELKFLEELKLLNDFLYSGEVLRIPVAFFTFVRTLKKLTLSNTKFDWSEASRLGQLECLEVLKLKQNAFTGESWRPEVGGFFELRVLWIEMEDLKLWEASELHFPRLRHLVLISCDKLEAVPYELASIHSFQEMRLENTIKAVKSAREIQRKKLESINFKLTIFPPDSDDSKATQ
ncbi:putative late blight resistance protein homolog R1A-10 [Nicotiana tabacum]|uniref:Late blight resistance protein homolog R1A-10 n=2 Tax=Nicotiana tabacum TaxID=4097 RepID=A0A1S4DK30_TOBAC|nr:PREDICTED: putative late blight resistance protein homolog R1A-10 [Nicotiana tabacum]